MELLISPRGLVARLLVREGEWPHLATILDLIRSSGITHGVDFDAIRSAADSGPGPAKVVVARGTPPRRGRPAGILYDFPTTDFARGPLDPHDVGVTRSLHTIPLVVPGQTLARKKEATPGIPGTDVFGRPVPPRPGRDVPLLASRNCRVVDGGTRIEATASGSPRLVAGGRITVVPVLPIPHNAGSATGDIVFDGIVMIEGNVEENVQIRAGVDIVVKGEIRGGRLRALGSVIVKNGIRHHAEVNACGRIVARFAEHSSLRSGSDIVIARDLLFCEVESQGEVKVGGRLIGGKVRSDIGIRAQAVGSRSGTRTTVILEPGGSKRSRIAAIEGALSHTRARLALVCSKLPQTPPTSTTNLHPPPLPVSRNRLEAVERQLLGEIRDHLRELLARKAAPEAPVSTGCRPRVHVEQAIFAGVDLSINGARLVARNQLPAGQLFEYHGRILSQLSR